jgi:tetratricopeptide (TPR) repeat protein
MLGLVAGLSLLAWGVRLGARHLWARHHEQLAELALQGHDLELAQRHLDQCLEVWGERPALHLRAALVARQRDDYDQADAHLRASADLGGETEAVQLERDLLIAQQGEPDLVLADLTRAAAADSRHIVPVLEALGKGYLNRFVKSDALRCFNKLLKQQPHHAPGLLWRGKTYESQQRLSRALQDYERAVQLAPALDEARLHLASLLQRLGRPREALPHYECLRVRLPGTAEVLLGLARCRHDLHDLDETRRLLRTLLAAHPDQPAALLELGLLDFHAGDTGGAEKWLRQAARRQRHDAEAQRALLRCLKAQGKDPARCLKRLEQIDLEGRPLHALMRRAADGGRDAPLRHEIGQRLQRLGRQQEAVSWFFAALGDDPRYRPARAALADHFERAGQRYRSARLRAEAQDPAGSSNEKEP